MGIPLEEPLARSNPPTRRTPGLWKQTGVLATTIAATIGMTLGGAAPAAAAPDDNSEALGKFLGGQALGIDLDDLAEVNGALAENPSGENPLVTNPLGVEVLNALNIDLGDGIQLLGENGVIQLGAVNQYAEAQDSGDAYAASGAVTDQGAIAVGGSDDYPSDASLNLDALLPEGTEGLVSDLSLELGALSSSIDQQDGAEPVTDYQVAGANLNLESPAVGDIYTSLLDTVDTLQITLDGLSGTLEDGISQGINLGGLANIGTDVTFTAPDLSALLPEDVIGESSGVTVDLTTGAVNVDLETLLASDDSLPNLNEMPANSELLSGEITAAITDGITQAVADVVTEIVANLQETIGATDLGIEADVQLIGGTAGITVNLNANLQQIIDGEAEDSVSVTTNGVVSLLQPLLNLLGLGEASQLGNTVLNVVGSVLGDTLDVLTDLETVVDDITGPLATEVVGPVLDVVNQVASVTVNAQPEDGDLGVDSSTVRALQVTLLPQTELAQVNLASSTVRGTAVSYDPTVTVDPDTADVGDSVTVGGSDFVPNSTVTVEITDANDEVVDTLEGVEVNENGEFETQWDVPEDTTPGELTVTATDDQDPSISGAATLTVNEQSESVQITSPSEGETISGDSVPVTGTAEPEVDVDVTLGDQTTTVTSETDGSWSAEFNGVEPGSYTVTATDGTTDDAVDFTVEADGSTDDNTADNTDDNTSDNTEVNTSDNTDDNVAENDADNTEVNTSDNTDVNSAENQADNTEVNTSDNTDVNTEVNTADNTGDNAEVNTEANTEVNTATNVEVNTADNTGDNTDVNTSDNAADNTSDNTEVNQADNTEVNTSDNTDVNTEVNTADNTSENTGDNAEVNTEANTEDNTSDNADDNAAENTEVNTATNVEVNTADNTGDNTEVNTSDNADDNTSDNTDENQTDNTEVNTEVNTSDNTSDNTEVNTSDNTDENSAENQADNTEVNTSDNAAENTEVNTATNVEVNTADNTDVNTSDNTSENTGDNAEVNTEANTEDNTSDNADDNAAENTEVNTATNVEVNTADNTGDNTDVNTSDNAADNTSDNTEVNTSDNTDVNTEVNTADNTGDNTEVNTEANTEDNTSDNADDNQTDNTEVNTSDNTADNSVHPEIWVTPGEISQDEDVTVNGNNFNEDSTVTIGIREMPGGEIEVLDEEVPVDADGEFYEILSLEGYDPGDYQIVVTGNETDKEARDSLRINDADWLGTIDVAPEVIEIGDSTTVYGDNYTPSGTATIVLEPRFSDGEVVLVSETVAINNAGSLEYVIDTSEFEGQLEEGNYRVVVTDNETGNSASKTIVLENPDVGTETNAGDNTSAGTGDNTGDNSPNDDSHDHESSAVGGSAGKSGGDGSQTVGSSLAATGATIAASAVGALLLLMLGTILVVRARKNATAK